MTHSHEYSFWHAHMHDHDYGETGMSHDTGHFHLYAQTHNHGAKSNLMPHSHKEKQYHPENDVDGPYHHHALADHKPLDYDVAEHHPECKLPYYGGGLQGCIDRCEAGKKREGA